MDIASAVSVEPAFSNVKAWNLSVVANCRLGTVSVAGNPTV